MMIAATHITKEVQLLVENIMDSLDSFENDLLDLLFSLQLDENELIIFDNLILILIESIENNLFK